MGCDYENYFDGLETSESEDLLHIFTAKEAKPNADFTWFYRLVSDTDAGEDVTMQESGKVTLCDCEECNRFGAELPECFFAYLALDWAKQNTPDMPILLWVGSKKILFTLSKELYGDSDRYRCLFLRTLFEDLGRLLSELGVVTVEYSYANKGIISANL